MWDYLFFVAGIICAYGGGELFVQGSVGLAKWMRISPALIAATIAAFATSSPEFSVSVSAAIAKEPEIALGDALGSNIVNIALILAIAMLIAPIKSERKSVLRDYITALAVPFLTLFVLIDGVISRVDAILLMVIFVVWLFLTIREAKRQRQTTSENGVSLNILPVILKCIIGLGLLVAAGTLIVTGARGIAIAWGMSEFVIGATVVAIGTSAPELATVVIAKLRGHDDVGLGTVIGSNIFNGLLIVGCAALINPIKVDIQHVSFALICGTMALILVFPRKGKNLGRVIGVSLLALYAVYVMLILNGVIVSSAVPMPLSLPKFP